MNLIRRATRIYGRVFPVIFLLAFAVQWGRNDAGRDTAILFVGAANPRVGESIYYPLPEPGVFQQQPVYNYPPPLAAALRPLTHLSYSTFARVWLVWLSLAFWVFAAACSRILTGRYAPGHVLTAGALLFFLPGVLHSWNMGNADLIVWASVALALAHTGTARGAALATGALLKVLPVWALLFALRERKVWVGATIVSAVSLLAMASAFNPWGESLTWLTRILPTLSQGELWRANTDWSLLGWKLPNLAPGNLSLAMLPVYPFARAGQDIPVVARVWLAVAGVGLPLLAGWRFRSRPVDVQVAAVLAVTVLAAPILRINYLPMLVPCVLVWWSSRPAGGAP